MDETMSVSTDRLWAFPGGDPSTSSEQNPIVIYNTAGTYDVTLTVSNDFGTESVTDMNIVNVNFTPLVDFDFVANGLTVAFTSNAQLAENYQWNFGDGIGSSIEENPTYTYSSPGVYEVTLLASNVFCGAGLTLSVEVIVSSNIDVFC